MKIFKHYSKIIMDVPFTVMITVGMYKKLKKHTNNISGYIRYLIMNDLNIDENGESRK